MAGFESRKAPWRRFRALGAVTATAALLVLTACATPTTDGTDTPTDGGSAELAPSTISGTPLEGKTIALVSGGPVEYYVTSLNASKLAVEALGGEVIEYDSGFDGTTELAHVRTAITQQVDGIIIIPLSTAGEQTALDLLKEAGIPAVMLYGWDPAFEDLAAGFVQVDFYEYGRLVGEQFKELVPDGPVAIIQGQPGRNEINEASTGFRDGFGNDDVIVEELPANWDRQLAFEVTQTILTAHPDLKGIYVMNDDMALGAVNALGDKISDVIIGSMNGSPSGLEAWEAGTITVMTQNSIPIESSQAVRILAHAIGGLVQEPKLCFTPIQLAEKGSSDLLTWVASDALIEEGLNTPCTNG